MQQTLHPTAGRLVGASGLPLAPEEVARFVAGWLSASGRPRGLVEPEAVLALAQHSGGSLHRVGELAEAAIAGAEREGAVRVLRRHVESASTGDGAEPRPGELASSSAGDGPAQGDGPAGAEALPVRAPVWQRVARWAAAAVLAVLLAAGAGWAFSEWLFSRDQRTQVADRSRPTVTPRDGAGAAGSMEAPAPPQALARQPEQPEPSRVDPAPSGTPPDTPLAPTAPDAPVASAGGGQPALPPDMLPDLLLSGGPVMFRGSVTNETMGQSGQMSLAITRQGPGDAVTARFRAWGGLIGTGELTGRMSQDGRLSLSGQLMMGRNPFDCELAARVAGERLQGSATFARTGGTYATRSTFTLARP